MNREKLVEIEAKLIGLLKDLDRLTDGIVVEKELAGHWERLKTDLEKELNVILKLIDVKNSDIKKND